MKEILSEEMKKALKQRDKIKLETIRSLLSAIQYEEMNKGQQSLSADDTLSVLNREAKKRKEEFEYAERADRKDILEKLKIEMTIIEGFLPQKLSEEDLRQIAQQIKSENSSANFGAAMKRLKELHGGKYDGKDASRIIKEYFP
jgi:uncharacterized protein YqeY